MEISINNVGVLNEFSIKTRIDSLIKEVKFNLHQGKDLKKFFG